MTTFSAHHLLPRSPLTGLFTSNLAPPQSISYTVTTTTFLKYTSIKTFLSDGSLLKVAQEALPSLDPTTHELLSNIPNAYLWLLAPRDV